MTDSIDTEADSSAPDQVPEKKIPAGETGGDDASLEDELAQSKAVAEEHWAKYLRVAAEMENYKKRNIKEREILTKYGSQGILQELLPILDNFQRAIESANESFPIRTDAMIVLLLATLMACVLCGFGLRTRRKKS